MENDEAAVSSLDQVSGSSLYWALLALALYAMTQPSNLWPGISATFGHSISPQRCSPINCLIDGCFDLAYVVELASRRVRPRDEDTEAVETFDSATSVPSTNRRSTMIFLIAVFMLGPLPQAVKIFATQGIPWTQTYCAIFLIAIIAKAALFLQHGHTTEESKASSMAKLGPPKRLIRVGLSNALEALSVLIHLFWFGFLWWEIGVFVPAEGTAAHDVLLAKSGTDNLWGRASNIHLYTACCLFLAIIVWPRLSGPIGKILPPIPLLYFPTTYLIQQPHYMLQAAESTASRTHKPLLRVTAPFVSSVALCIALAYILQMLVDWLVPPHINVARLSPETHTDSAEPAESADPPPYLWTEQLKAIAACDRQRRGIFNTILARDGGFVARERELAPAQPASNEEQQDPSMSPSAIVFFSVLNIIHSLIWYCFLVLLLTTGVLAWSDIASLAGRHIKEHVACMAGLNFFLLTVTLHYLVIFDGSGTVSPGWTRFLG